MRCYSLLLASLFAAGACGFDGSTTSATDEDGTCQDFATHLDSCASGTTSGDLNLNIDGTYTFDTDTGTLQDPDGQSVNHIDLVYTATEGELRAIVVDSFTLGPGSTLRPIGSIPFAIVSMSDILIEGTIDANGKGAGSRVDCGTSNGSKGGNDRGGAGGGGGGAFQGAGGSGGVGDSGSSTRGDSGPGGETAAPLPMSPLGGCPGGDGGDGEDPGSRGDGGDGGGAVYLVSATRITIPGGIQAGGQGGTGGAADQSFGGDAGGGGGGSGGYIALEAPTIDISDGVIAANGGGGGEGSGNGDPGEDGSVGQLSIEAAFGGSGGAASGSEGGEGSSISELAGTSVTDFPTDGAGGGGGGAGFIFLLPLQDPGGTSSPPAL